MDINFLSPLTMMNLGDNMVKSYMLFESSGYAPLNIVVRLLMSWFVFHLVVDDGHVLF